ncbi:MAG: hypothetical protein R3F60_07810 [bacterium]
MLLVFLGSAQAEVVRFCLDGQPVEVAALASLGRQVRLATLDPGCAPGGSRASFVAGEGVFGSRSGRRTARWPCGGCRGSRARPRP